MAPELRGSVEVLVQVAVSRAPKQRDVANLCWALAAVQGHVPRLAQGLRGDEKRCKQKREEAH